MAIKSMTNPANDHPVDQTLLKETYFGSLQYLMFTRQGVVHAINKAYLQSPIEANMQVVKVSWAI